MATAAPVVVAAGAALPVEVALVIIVVDPVALFAALADVVDALADVVVAAPVEVREPDELGEPKLELELAATAALASHLIAPTAIGELLSETAFWTLNVPPSLLVPFTS